MFRHFQGMRRLLSRVLDAGGGVMATYIPKETALKVVETYGTTSGFALGRHTGLAICIASEIAEIPAADVAPVVHGPCPYCDAKTNDFIPINQTVEYSGIEIALNRQGMLRVRVYESGQKTFTTQDIVEIKFCPNCGAKMDGGAD